MPSPQISLIQRFKRIIGFPRLQSIKEIIRILLQFRFLFFVYFLLLLFYYVVFYWHSGYVTERLFKNYGNGYGSSFSASLLEDLAIFPFLSLAITVISIKASLKKPQEYGFDDRIRAIMNSQKVEFDDNVFEFLKKETALLLAYNRLVDLYVDITDYYADQNCYQYVYERNQITTNMCKDQDFKSLKSKVSIYADLKVNNSYGRLLQLTRVDPNNFNSTINPPIIDVHGGLELDPDENVFDLPYVVPRDAEYGFKLRYTVFSKISEENDLEGWSYCGVLKYTSKIHFKIQNNLHSKQAFKINIRRRDADNKVKEIKMGLELRFGDYFHYTENEPLSGDDRIEFYIYKPH